MVKIVADNLEKVLIDPALVIQGKDGKDGEQGIPGVDGLPGKDGKDGRDGRDGLDGRDGKDGISFWIEYDKKTNTIVFKNDGGKKNPDPIKLPPAVKGWGYGAGGGRGGVTAQSDWNQKDKNAVDYIKNKPQVTIIPEAIKKLEGLVIQYIGETITGYEHGYFYECKEKDISTITFDPDKISCSGDDFMSFVKVITPDYKAVVKGTMTYLEDGDIWVFVGQNADDEEVVTYQQYTGDFENYGFEFTGEFEDEEVISFTRTVEITYGWERIDVQPGTGRGRFLSLWNCATGLAVTDPPTSPYIYSTGDYFIVSNVSESTNYKPNGFAYNSGIPSTTAETEDVSVDDTYVFDGTSWKLQQNVTKVRDVTVNNTSVVTGGVAQIPIAQMSGDYGLVKLSSDAAGIMLSNSGTLQTRRATDADITASTRTQINRPIVPANLDLAVKAGVTSNSITLNSTEKSSACDWLGAVKDATIGGTSIVTDGVAAIPNASGDTYGATKLSSSLTSTSNTVAATAGTSNSLAKNIITGADVFDKTETYAVGDKVRYSSGYYECKTAITSGHAWNANEWTKITIQGQIDEIKEKVVVLTSGDSITLVDNTIYSGGEITSFSITGAISPAASFDSEINFSSGATATTITYNTTINWVDGSDSIQYPNGTATFTPAANTRYNVLIWYDGSQWNGISKAV